MSEPIKVTRKRARLLRHMLEYHRMDSPFTGLTAHLVVGVGPATFYPLIVLMERAQWAHSEWEVVPTGEDRPRRRYYFLTEDGVRWAEQALKKYDNRKPWWKRLAKWVEEAADDMNEED